MSVVAAHGASLAVHIGAESVWARDRLTENGVVRGLLLMAPVQRICDYMRGRGWRKHHHIVHRCKS